MPYKKKKQLFKNLLKVELMQALNLTFISEIFSRIKKPGIRCVINKRREKKEKERKIFIKKKKKIPSSSML